MKKTIKILAGLFAIMIFSSSTIFAQTSQVVDFKIENGKVQSSNPATQLQLDKIYSFNEGVETVTALYHFVMDTPVPAQFSADEADAGRQEFLTTLIAQMANGDGARPVFDAGTYAKYLEEQYANNLPLSVSVNKIVALAKESTTQTEEEDPFANPDEYKGIDNSDLIQTIENEKSETEKGLQTITDKKETGKNLDAEIQKWKETAINNLLAKNPTWTRQQAEKEAERLYKAQNK